jgi:hypothetical protein
VKLNVKVVDGWLAGVNSRVVNTAMSHAAPLLMKQCYMMAISNFPEFTHNWSGSSGSKPQEPMWKALRATQAPVWVTMPVAVSLRLCVVFNSRRVV